MVSIDTQVAARVDAGTKATTTSRAGTVAGRVMAKSDRYVRPTGKAVVEERSLFNRALKWVTDPVADALSSTARTAKKIGNAADFLLPTGAHDPRFKGLQESGDGKFVRVKNEPEPWFGKKWLDRVWWGAPVAYVDPEKPPTKPQLVKGVVWNETLDDAKLVRGDRNPTYDHARLGAKFESKMFEAEFIQKYAPGAIAHTESVADVVKALGLKKPKTAAEREAYLKALQEGLHKRFPEGFFVKGAFDANTGGNLPTNKSDFAALYKGYHEHYMPFEAAMEKQLKGDELINTLRGHEFKGGNVLQQLIDDPKRVVVQERMKLARWTRAKLPVDVQPFQEIRVHVLDGLVIPGASSHRWSVEKTLAQQTLIRRAEKFAQEAFDKFPRHVTSNLSFAPDVAMLEDGSFKFVELNVGGYSGVLYRNPVAARAVSEAVTGKELFSNRVIRPVATVVGKSSKYAGKVFRRAAKAVRIP